MSADDKTIKLLKALADRTRLQILQCIREGKSNPGEMAKTLKRHRSTIEKHLRVLRAAGIVEKVPSLTEGGQLSIRYKISRNVTKLLQTIQDECKNYKSG